MHFTSDLIRCHCEKNYEIAEHVGYEDANYFGYVFKRKYGMSPSKYRTEHMGK